MASADRLFRLSSHARYPGINPLTLEQVRAVEEGREIPAVTTRAKRNVKVELPLISRAQSLKSPPLAPISRLGRWLL